MPNEFHGLSLHLGSHGPLSATEKNASLPPPKNIPALALQACLDLPLYFCALPHGLTSAHTPPLTPEGLTAMTGIDFDIA